jgi:hypothetical protein
VNISSIFAAFLENMSFKVLYTKLTLKKLSIGNLHNFYTLTLSKKKKSTEPSPKQQSAIKSERERESEVETPAWLNWNLCMSMCFNIEGVYGS